MNDAAFAGWARPRLQLLTSDQKENLHIYSIRILGETGIKVESKVALDIFSRSDALRIEDQVVYIQQELVDECINLAPSNIEIFDKQGKHAFHLGIKQGFDTHFGIGVTNTWFQNIESDEVELFTRKHMQEAVSLGNLLDNFAMISTPGVLSDVPVDVADLYASLDMYAHTDKPLVLLISGEGKLNSVLDLLSSLHGDLGARPFCIPYVNPITPLVLNKETSDKMITTLERGLPLMYSNYGMYGGTSPVTEGGTLALLNAELLAGLVFSQLIRAGSQVILGSLPAAFNMSSMGSYYTPATYLLNLACAEMMEHYGIPHCGTSGSNNGRGADLPAAENLWINHLSSCLGKVGCAPFVGGNLESLAFSPSTVVLSNHIIGEAKKFARGFSLDEKAVNLEEIFKVGHGGSYFTSEQTLASLEELGKETPLWSSMTLKDWKAQGKPTAQNELIGTTMDLYSKAQQATKDQKELVQKGEQFIKDLPSEPR